MWRINNFIDDSDIEPDTEIDESNSVAEEDPFPSSMKLGKPGVSSNHVRVHGAVIHNST